MQWNLQSYFTQFEELKLILKEYQPACITLQETLHKNRNMLPPSGYHIIKSDPKRDDNHDRGAAILINRRIFYQPIQINTDLQVAAARVYLDKIYTICSLYLPHIPVNERDLVNLIQQLQPPFLIMGDLNSRSPLWGDDGISSPNAKGQLIERIMLNEPISILNTGSKPTHYHIQTNSYSIIDLCLCSPDCIPDFEYSVIPMLHGSDHYPIKLSLIESDENGPAKMIKYNINKANWSQYNELTKTEEKIENFNSVNTAIEYIINLITKAADQAIPKTSPNFPKPPVPWWNNELKQARKERNRAERLLKRQYSIENKIAYKRRKARFRYLIKQSRKKSWQDYLSSINKNTNMHSIWKKVQKISGKYKISPPPILKDNTGNIISDKKTVANMLATQFAETSSTRNYSNSFLNYKRRIEKQPLKFETNREYPYNDPFTLKEYLAAISNTTETSAGHDRITYAMIKSVHHTLQKLIFDTFNKIYASHQFPDSWTLAITIGFAKPNKDSFQSENYRPISLTPCLCKLMEKMVNSRITWYLEKNSLISVHQSGFRPNRSTTDNLVILENGIQSAICNRQHFIGVLFDIQKAYDTAWRHGILRKLHEFGLRGNLSFFMKGFLSNRKMQVRIGSVYSDVKYIEEGIPQGSVLSCTCFMIAIDDITKGLPQNINKTLYVDDFAIFATGSTTNLIERRLQTAISKLENWSEKTGFKFSTNKTESIHICRKRNCPKIAPNLTLYHRPISSKEQVKYLGVIFDKSFTWKPHIDNLKTKCTKTLDLFKHLTSKTWGADRKSLLRLHTMLLKPMIDYGSEIYSSAAPTHLNKVSVIQNSALRIATGAFRSSPITSLHSDTGIKPYKYSIETKMLNFLIRTRINPSHPCQELNADNNPTNSFFSRVTDLSKQYNLNLNQIIIENTNNIHPWKSPNVIICDEMLEYNKKNTHKYELRHHFNCHFRKHNNHFNIFTDGSKIENGVGFAIVTPTTTIAKKINKIASNFTAELLAIYEAIQIGTSQTNYNIITIVSDCRSALQAITKYNSKNPIVQQIFQIIATTRKIIYLCWSPSHVGIIYNEAADKAAQDAAANGIYQEVKIPKDDIKAYIKQISTKRWTDEWQSIAPENNKLRTIKHHTRPFSNIYFTDRLWERTLCRLRIGHTFITHGYLMEKSERPICEMCNTTITIRHILLECPQYNNNRQAFSGNSLTHIITHMCEIGGPLHKFITQTNLIHQI